jgi:hypothetical protein
MSKEQKSNKEARKKPAKSGRLDHQLGEESMACIRFTLSKSWDQSFTKY